MRRCGRLRPQATAASFGAQEWLRYRAQPLPPRWSLDPAFGGNGRAIVSQYTGGALEISLDDLGRITELGAAGTLLRLQADGTVDPSGPNVAFTLPREGGFGADGAGGYFVGGRLGGCSRGCTPIDTAVSHVTGNGALDADFGSFPFGNGLAAADFGSQSDGASDVAADNDGRPIIVGFSGDRMMVGRLTMTPGPPDADGDRVENSEDLCPYLYGRNVHRPGCPKVRPKLRLHLHKKADLWVGRSESPDARCAVRQTVKIFRARPGRDEFLSEAESARDGSFTADGNLRPGAYYAFVSRAFKPRIGSCRRARSNQVVIRG